MAEISRLELEKLSDKIDSGFEGIRSDFSELKGSMATHFTEDAQHQGRVSMEMGVVKEKLSALSENVADRQKFLRNWIAGLIAVALAGAVGFLIRNAIDVQVAKPMQQQVPK